MELVNSVSIVYRKLPSFREYLLKLVYLSTTVDMYTMYAALTWCGNISVYYIQYLIETNVYRTFPSSALWEM